MIRAFWRWELHLECSHSSGFGALRPRHHPSTPSDKITPRTGPLLVHKVLETKLDSAESAITCICFHPRRRGLCAVACGGRVYLVQHDLGLLATAGAAVCPAHLRSVASHGADLYLRAETSTASCGYGVSR